MRKGIFRGLLKLLANSKRNRWNCARREAWLDYKNCRAAKTTRERCWPVSTTGSPKASTLPTSRTPRHCYKNWAARMLFEVWWSGDGEKKICAEYCWALAGATTQEKVTAPDTSFTVLPQI